MADISLSQLINESLIAEEEDSSNRNYNSYGQTAVGGGSSVKGFFRNLGNSIKGTASKIGSKIKDDYEFYKRNPGQLRTPAKIAGAVAGGTAVAVGLKKGLDHYRDRNSFSGKVKKHGGKVAAGTLAALGAGIGVKALLKYLRSQKSNG